MPFSEKLKTRHEDQDSNQVKLNNTFAGWHGSSAPRTELKGILTLANMVKMGSGGANENINIQEISCTFSMG